MLLGSGHSSLQCTTSHTHVNRLLSKLASTQECKPAPKVIKYKFTHQQTTPSTLEASNEICEVEHEPDKLL